MLDLSSEAQALAGILLLALITVESGGAYLTVLSRGKAPATEFQKSYARAGHGHAGMFVTLGIITAVLTDATDLDGFWEWIARTGVPIAAIVMPAGFFFASLGKERTSPSRWWVLIPTGAAFLTAGLATLGIGLIAAS